MPEIAPSPAGREIASSRIIGAPRALVFRAFTDPERLAQWWGPEGFTNTFREFDFRPGGHWRFTMHGPDGTDYHNVSVFSEIIPPERIVFHHGEPIHQFQMTMTYEDLGPQTRLTWQMLFDTAEEAHRLRDFILQANQQNFDRLEAELAKT